MVEKVAVLYIHGMGAGVEYDYNQPRQQLQEPKPFAEDSIKAIKRRIPRKLHDRIVVKSVYWGHIADRIQRKLMDISTKDVRDGGAGLKDWKGIRYFLTNYLADTIFYQFSYNEKDGYHKIHEAIAMEMASLARDAGPEAPLIVIAHSLGSAIISNYLYDLQHDYHDKAEDEEALISTIVGDHIVKPEKDKNTINLTRGDTLMYFFTLGSPLAVYNTRYDDPEDFGLPIKVPSDPAKDFFSNYPEKEDKYWFNYYEDDDVIGFPLEHLSSRYAGVVKDIKINMLALNPLNFLTPLSHGLYWTNNKIVRHIAEKIKYLLSEDENDKD